MKGWLFHATFVDRTRESVIVDLQMCHKFSVALDETNDINDTAQLAVFVRYETDSIMQERLLTVLRMSGRTTGSIIFHTFKTFMEATDDATLDL